MEIINISKRKFRSLPPLEIPNCVYNTEAEMFVLKRKNRWNISSLVLKRLYNSFGEVFSNKLYTLNELIDKKDIIGIEELVMPTALATVGEEVIGYVMPLIENINLQEILNSKSFTHEQKVAYLKEIGELLERIKRVREYTRVTDFYLNDIHEHNFILNMATGRINAVDLDSSKIGDNLCAPARYLTTASKIIDFPKYRPAERSAGGVFEVDENTDIYCYIIMIFKYFFGDNIGTLKVEDFYIYLEYLSSIGVPKEFLDIISYIYSGKNNVNPYEYLDELAPFYGRTHKNTFKRVREKGLTNV